MNKKIYLDKQYFPSTYSNHISKTLSDCVSTKSNTVKVFENIISKFLNVSYTSVVATNSGTSALHLAMLASKLNNDVENKQKTVIMPVLTFIATANAARYCNYAIHFVDVDEKTWCINTNNILSSIKNNVYYNKYQHTCAIIYVDLYGNISNILNFKEDKFLDSPRVIVDASHSFGLQPDLYRKNKVDYFCYSFNGNKTITTGAGGLILEGNLGRDSYIDYIRYMSMQAKDANNEFTDIGFNYRMAGINASLGLMQLSDINYIVGKKSKFNKIYRDELKNILEFQQTEPYVNPVWWITAALFPDGIDIDDIQNKLNKKNIETKRVFKPLNMYKPYYIKGKSFSVAEMIYNRGLCLPSSVVNTEEDVYYVCKTIKKILGEIK